MKKPSGNIALGTLFLVLSVLPIAIMIAILGSNNSLIKDDPTMLVCLVLITVLLLVFGIFALRRGLIDRKAWEKGRKGVCVVERFDIHGSRYGAFVWMTVSFKGDDGGTKEHTVRIYQDDINTVSKGTKLECLILGDECYVDRDNLIIVKDEDIKEDLAA